MGVAGTTARWTWIWPALAWAILLITLVLGGSGIVYAAAGAALFGTVFAAVYHAEVVAHRVGEPFGTLILALAVTVIPSAMMIAAIETCSSAIFRERPASTRSRWPPWWRSRSEAPGSRPYMFSQP